jgi:hypothetical protein
MYLYGYTSHNTQLLMRYILVLIFLFSLSACNKKTSAEKAEKTQDSVEAQNKAANDLAMAPAVTDEKVGDTEADNLIDDYQAVVNDMRDLISKNSSNLRPVSESNDYKMISARSAKILKRSEVLEKRLAADRLKLYKSKFSALESQYSEQVEQLMAAAKGN